MHRYFWKGLIKTHTFFWSDWWKYCDITQQSHVLVQPAAVVVVVTPSTGVAGCAQCSWSQVSLLSCYSWCPSGMLLCLDTYRDRYCIVTSVSRYELFREAPVSLHPYSDVCCLSCCVCSDVCCLSCFTGGQTHPSSGCRLGAVWAGTEGESVEWQEGTQ